MILNAYVVEFRVRSCFFFFAVHNSTKFNKTSHELCSIITKWYIGDFMVISMGTSVPSCLVPSFAVKILHSIKMENKPITSTQWKVIVYQSGLNNPPLQSQYWLLKSTNGQHCKETLYHATWSLISQKFIWWVTNRRHYLTVAYPKQPKSSNESTRLHNFLCLHQTEVETAQRLFRVLGPDKANTPKAQHTGQWVVLIM